MPRAAKEPATNLTKAARLQSDLDKRQTKIAIACDPIDDVSGTTAFFGICVRYIQKRRKRLDALDLESERIFFILEALDDFVLYRQPLRKQFANEIKTRPFFAVPRLDLVMMNAGLLPLANVKCLVGPRVDQIINVEPLHT